MSSQKSTGKTGKKNIVVISQKEILYDTGADELIIVEPSKLGILKNEIEMFDIFKPYMQKLIPSEKGNEKDRGAEIKAIFHWMKEYADADNESKEKEILLNLDQKIKKKKDEILSKQNRDGDTTANASQLKDGDVKELLLFRQKRMVRIRSKKMKNHWRTFNRKQVEQQVKKELRDEKKEREKQKGPIKEAEIKFFEKKLFDKNGYAFKGAEEFSKLCSYNFFEDNDILEAGVSAQFLRYAAEAKFGATLDWKKEKTIKVSGKAEGSFALAQAKGDFKINIPDKDGFDIIKIIRDAKDEFVKNDAKPIYFLLLLKLEGSAFVGVCASIGLEAGVSLKNPTAKDGELANAEAGLDLFAGAKAGAEGQISANIKFIDDVNTNPKAVDWTAIGSVSYGVWGAVGIGVEAKIKIGYIDGKFKFIAKIGLVLKAGAGTYVKASIDAFNIGKLIWTIGTSLEWKHMYKVLDGKVHDLYQCVMMNCFYAGKKINEVIEEIEEDIVRIMTSNMVEDSFDFFKSLDDTFDKYIPGYSGFKKWNSGFWLLKGSYYLIKNERKKLRDRAIKMAIEAQRDDTWDYATWQMKVNLINDMHTGGSGPDDYTEEDKENAIILVLNSSRHSYEFKKIIQKLKDDFSVDIDNELDYRQKEAYTKLKKKFN